MFATAQRQMIVWTSALVLGLGVLTVHSMLLPPVSIANAKAKAPSVEPLNQTKNQAPTNSDEASRNPASLLPDSPAYAAISLDEKNTAQAVDLTLPCPSQASRASKQPDPNMNKTFTAAVKQIRLSGQDCGPQRNIASTEILNEANGFSATVFHPDDKTFTTDYISLAPGQNRIRILQISKEGHREETTFLVNRQ